MDPRFTIYKELKRDKRTSEHRVLAAYGSVYPCSEDDQEPTIRIITAQEYGRNPHVHPSFIFADYLTDFCKPITEERARKLHPRLFEYLDPCAGYSTVTLIHSHHEGRAPLDFPGYRTLYYALPWTNSTTQIHRAELLGTQETIEQIVAQVETNPDFIVEGEILPANTEDFERSGMYSFHERDITIEELKAWLTAHP